MRRSELLRRPERLFAAAAQVWDRIAVEALRDGRLTAASRESFAVYCETRAVADAMHDLIGAMPAEFTDPHSHGVAHPVILSHADLGFAALEMERALGIGPLGPALMAERSGQLGSLLDARFNMPDPRDRLMYGPLAVPGGVADAR